MKKTLGILLCLLALMICAGAAADVAIDETNFPDELFRQYIVEDGFDADGDSILSDSEIEEATWISCPQKGIKSLTGIAYFTELQLLYCSDNQLKELDLSKNTALLELDCDNNPLKSLDLSKCTALEKLWCRETQLTKLDVSKNTALQILSCSKNKLNQLNVSNNTALVELYCSENQLKSLDVSKCKALEELWCSDNQLTSLDVSKNAALKTLDCSFNQITSLSTGAALENLECYVNKLQTLDMRASTALFNLQCSDNEITTLDLSKNAALQYLWCDDNQMTELDVSHCPAMVNVIKANKREDRGTYWDYGEDEFGNPYVRIDKNLKINIGEEDDSVTVGGVRYALSGSTATAVGPEKKTAKTITIQATVNANGKTYKVTEIKASAFKKMTKLTKVTIGKNVKSIGKNAFYGCKKLKTIKINSKQLTSGKVGKNAFKGIYKKATITCPKGKAKTYKKWLTKKGVPKTAKIK